MTGIRFREGQPSDRDAILELRAAVFAGLDQEKQQADFWQWEFADSYAGPARILLAVAPDDRIAGHIAFVPQRYSIAARTMNGALAVDAMVHPQYRRQNVFSRLMSFAASEVRHQFALVTAFQIRKQVLGGMTAGGWSPAARLPVFLKPLFWRHHPDPLIRSLTSADLDQIDARLVTTAARQPRGADFLEWRYLRNPHWQYRIDGLFDGRDLGAFVIHRDCALRGMRAVAIADAGFSPGNEALLRKLLMSVCGEARRRGRNIAAALMSHDHPAARVLRRSGFWRGPHTFQLLLQIFDDSLRREPPPQWSLSWGDTDHL